MEGSPELSQFGTPHFGWRRHASHSPLVLTFTFKYKPGMQAKVDALQDKLISFNRPYDALDGDPLLSYTFEHIDGGFKTVEVDSQCRAASRQLLYTCLL